MKKVNKEWTNRLYVDKVAAEYRKFMRIDKLPDYAVKCKNDQHGLVSFNKRGNNNIISVHEGLYADSEGNKPSVYHELTHLVDYNTLLLDDKIQVIHLHPYAEFRASQVELFKALGMSRCWESVDITLESRIAVPLGEESLGDALDSKVELINENFIKLDYKTNIQHMSILVGSILNYIGYIRVANYYGLNVEINLERPSRELGGDIQEMYEILSKKSIGKREIVLCGECYESIVAQHTKI